MEDLVLSCLESRVEENRNLYARFLVGPFLKGDALTVATALRRILLSSIESIGITALYIQGITHEFSTIVGVRESVLELSLNFQAIVLSYEKTFFQKKSFFDDLQIGYLQVQGPKVIYANHLKLPLGVKLVDPTQYIATVSKEGSIVLKFMIGKKRAFLHQNTGPESFFGNPARDLPITGKVSKKNLGRAKKTCFYKKGSTIDWLPVKLSGQNVQNILERQATAFDPRLVTKQRVTKLLTSTSTNLREQSDYKYKSPYKSKICTCKKICMSPNKSLICTPLQSEALYAFGERGIKSTRTSTNLRFVRSFVRKGTYVRRFVLVRSPSRSFTNAEEIYKSPICIENFVAPAKRTESFKPRTKLSFVGREGFVRRPTKRSFVRPHGLNFLNLSGKKSGFAVTYVRMFAKRARAVTKRSFVRPSYKSTRTKLLRTCRTYKANKSPYKYKSKIWTCKPCLQSFVQHARNKICTYLGLRKKFYLHKKKGQFAMRFFKKQRVTKLLTSTNRRFVRRFVLVRGPSKFLTNVYKFTIYPSISPLLKKDIPLFIKKHKVVKEKNVKKKKVLFFKNNDNVFKSNICLRNVIPLDFSVTPVLKVNFVVEIDDEVLYLRQKIRERIILEVWTNGSIHPRQAVHDAALSLTDIFASFRSVYGAKS